MPHLFLYFIAFGLLVIAIRYISAFLRLLKLAIQHEHYEIKAPPQVPKHLRQLFKKPIQDLQELGFKYCCYVQAQEMHSVNLSKQWWVLLYNRGFNSYALLKIRRNAESFNLFDLEFLTFFKDRTLLLTLNCQACCILGEIPKTIVEDSYTHRTDVQWELHCNKLEELSGYKQVCVLAPQSFIKALQLHYDRYINHLSKSHKISSIPGSKIFKIVWKEAFRLTIKQSFGISKIEKVINHKKRLETNDKENSLEIPVDVEVDNFRWLQQLERGYFKPKMGAWILLISLILFAISFVPLFSLSGVLNLQGLLLLIGVIYLHELGHFLAMKIFGYEDKSIFFLPFLGAAATGHKDEATLTEKVWVLLAGPLPGLVLGIGVAIAIYGKSDYPEWLMEASWMLISINLFNLFPVFPLDGGKVADLLLFSQYPYTDVLFKIFAVAVLGLLGMGFPLLLGIAVIVGLSIPLGFRSAKLGSQLREERFERSPHNPDSLLHSIYEKIQEFGYGKLPFGQRYQLAKNLLQRYREASSKWTTRVFLVGLYCVSLLGGIVGTLHASNPQWTKWITAFQNPEMFTQTIVEEQLKHANQTLEKNPQDVNAYIMRAGAYMNLQDYGKAMADVEQALKLDPNSASAYHIRSTVRRQMGDEEGAQEDVRKAALLTHKQQLEYADKMLQRNPNSTQGLHMRAEARYQMEDYQGALEDYNRFLTLKKDNSWIYFKRGQTRYELKDYEGAIADANEAINLAPNFSPAYQLRSDARRNLGDEEGAIADEQKANSFDEQVEW